MLDPRGRKQRSTAARAAIPRPPIENLPTTRGTTRPRTTAKATGPARYKGATPSYIIGTASAVYQERIWGRYVRGSAERAEVARDLNRRALGYDVHPTRKDIFRLDARKLPPELSAKVDFVFMDPPYSTHLDYGDDPRDIGKLDVAKGSQYYDAMEQAFREALRVLKPGGYLGLYVSDSFVKGQAFHPIGFELFERVRRVGFEPVDIIAVVRHNKTLEMGNYRKAAEEGNFFLRGFNYLFIMRKPTEDAKGRA